MSGRADLPATLGRLWAVAKLTLLEAVRRRVFVLLLLFGAAIISSAAFFPAIDAESRLRLIEVWSVRAALLFSVIVSIFLAGFSLPGDFETRRVYTLVTKPVHKMTLFGGKFLGFFLLLAIFLGFMGVISVGYIRVVSWLSKDFPPLVAEPRFFADGLQPLGNATRMKDSDRVGVAGMSNGLLLWKFTGLDRKDFGDRMKVKFAANLGRRDKEFAIEGNVILAAVNPQSGAKSRQIGKIHTNEPIALEIDPSLISADGSLDVAVEPAEPDLSVDADREGVVLYGLSRSFDLNYFRGMLLVLFQSTVVMAVTLAGSTFLNAPISIVLGIFLYLIGVMWSHIQEGVRDIDLQLEQFRQALSQGHARHQDRPEDLPPWLLKTSTAISRVTLKAVPDFSQFNFSDYLLADHAVMGRDLGGGFLAMLTRVAALIVIGLVAMGLRDFAT